MATSYKKTLIKSFPKVTNVETSDTLYWKHLEFPITRKSYGAVTFIDVSPTEPYRYAVTSSTKVEVFSCETSELHKTMTKFGRTAYSGTFRSDGKLLVAGGEEGLVKLFDVDSKSLLRQFKGHTRPVHMTRFTADKVRVVSGGDDKVVRLFDVPSETELLNYGEHEDYIRAGAVSKSNSDILLTGSYDHSARLYDIRTSESVLKISHGCPIEYVLMHPNGGLLYTAGGETVKVWDALSGGRLLHTVKGHHKTVTSLCFCSDYKRLVSAGLDRHVKIYDVATYKLVHSLDFMSSILSVAIPPDDSSISVGLADGHFVTQRRRNAEDIMRERQEKKESIKASYRYRLTQKSFQKQEDDAVIEHKRKEHLARYDMYFKKFEYSKALTAVMEVVKRRKQPEVTFSVIEELIRRDGLRRAMAGRTEEEQNQFVVFFTKNVSNVKFTDICIEAADIFLDIYQDETHDNPTLVKNIKALRRAIYEEVNMIKELHEVTGILDAIFASSQHGAMTSQQTVGSQPADVVSASSVNAKDGVRSNKETGNVEADETQSDSDSESDMDAEST